MKTGANYRGDVKKDNFSDVWMWSAKNPVSYEDYTYYQNKECWPGDVEQPRTIGDNNPPDDYTVLKEEIEAQSREALSWLEKNKIDSQDKADKLANWKKILGDLFRKAEKIRKAEKQPHLDAGKEVDEKYTPLKDTATAAGKAVGAALTVYMNEQERIARAAAEAERKRLAEEQQKREEEARKIAKEASENGQAVPEVEITPEPVTEVVPDKIQAGGARGRKTALKSFWSASINDYETALKHYGKNPKVKELIQQLANADARSMKDQLNVPGVTPNEERKAA